MNHTLLRACGLALLSASAWAHFPFLVPTPDESRVRVLLSETLEADARVSADLVLDGTYGALLSDGSERLLVIEESSEGPALALGGDLGSPSLLFGTLDMGVTQRNGGTPHVLVYHAKTLLRDAFDPRAHRVEPVPIEITPVRAGQGVRLQLLVDGAPAAESELVVLLPGGGERELVTDANGLSEILDANGRYGAWARSWIQQPGVRDGKPYEEVRRYATLVFDYDAPPRAVATTAASEPSRLRGHARIEPETPISAASPLAVELPESTSSFGAVQSEGWLYVYGGHVAPTHEYHVSAVSGRFARIDLGGTGAWEELPPGPALQGMNLAAHRGWIYRVGGMEPRNARGEKVDNWSVASVARYDPSQERWAELAPLPEPRSSHDVAIVDEKLYVIGGWTMSGAEGVTWPDSMLVLDLSDPRASWTSLPQPFRRRALIVAVHDARIHVLGGFDEDDEPSRRVDVFDPREARWSQAPGLPGGVMNGFAPAACVHDRRLYVGLGDGTVHRLDDGEFRWEQVATSTPRIVHRMVALGERVLLLGGASRGDNLALIEAFVPPPASFDGAREASAERATANAWLARAAASRASLGDGVPARAIEASAPAENDSAGEESDAPAANATPRIGEAAPPTPSAGALATAAVQTHCPVMNEEPVDAASHTVEHAGRTVLLCCRSCVRKWNKDPERYASSPCLPQLARPAERSSREDLAVQ